MKLPNRLRMIADLVPEGSKIADIGTDHAYIPVFLTINGKIKSAIACDIADGPIERAKNTIKRYRLEDKIFMKKGNGFEKIIQGEADTAIIAGMGGTLICEILKSPKSPLFNTFILQPQTAFYELRKYLSENGFIIVDEELTMEGEKLYNAFKVTYGNSFETDDFYFHVGKKLIEKNHHLLPVYLEREIRKTEMVINGLKLSKNNHTYELSENQARLDRLIAF